MPTACRAIHGSAVAGFVPLLAGQKVAGARSSVGRFRAPAVPHSGQIGPHDPGAIVIATDLASAIFVMMLWQIWQVIPSQETAHFAAPTGHREGSYRNDMRTIPRTGLFRSRVMVSEVSEVSWSGQEQGRG
jgi:hypothetical protein